jgi:hypothetical protein
MAYVVNPGGLTVDVTDSHAEELLASSTAEKPWRMATDAEAAECAAREAGKSDKSSKAGK